MKIVIDTDPGIDDALALMMALNSPDLEILGSRGDWTRTSDLGVPNAARYQAAPHPDAYCPLGWRSEWAMPDSKGSRKPGYPWPVRAAWATKAASAIRRRRRPPRLRVKSGISGTVFITTSTGPFSSSISPMSLVQSSRLSNS